MLGLDDDEQRNERRTPQEVVSRRSQQTRLAVTEQRVLALRDPRDAHPGRTARLGCCLTKQQQRAESPEREEDPRPLPRGMAHTLGRVDCA